MIYGGFKANGLKIGADPPIDEEKALRMRKNTVEKYQSFSPHKLPHLDVGTGADFANRFLKNSQKSDIDLDTQKYPYKAKTFNTITSFEVIEHLYNPLFHLQEVRRVLSTNGRLYLTTPDDWSLIYRIEHLRGRKYGPHFHQFTEFDIRQIMARAGLTVLHLSSFRRGGSGTVARVSKNLLFVIAKR